MALPKFSQLSTSLQILAIVVVGAALGGVSEYLFLKPAADSNANKKKTADQLERDIAPLRPYEQRQKQLVIDNQQLQLQLANLRQIVPDEKEVDGFIRLVTQAANTSGIAVRRFTAKPNMPRDYYVEVPFEMELDGPYHDVVDFYDRLSKMARIVNVSELKMAAIQGGKSVGNKPYAYSPAETVVAVCAITTFFSREEEAPAANPSQAARAPQKK